MGSGYYELTIEEINKDTDHSITVSLKIPADLLDIFDFKPGQFINLRAQIEGQEIRRSYSICSPRSRLHKDNLLQIGIRVVEGGIFSNWAMNHMHLGMTLEAMKPEGRFTIQHAKALHRVGFAAGSGITPILSIMASTMEESKQSKFTLVYGNRRMDTIMLNEALQDLKDRYPARITLVHILSQQSQEVPLLEGRIDAVKIKQLMGAFLPAQSMDEVFVCGPNAMIETVEQSLKSAGVNAKRIRTERFCSLNENQLSKIANPLNNQTSRSNSKADVSLVVYFDGKKHDLRMSANDHVLTAALAAGLDLPYSCQAGVCCTCRAKVMQGTATMDKNFTLENWEIAQGFVLSCQARPTSHQLTVSYDER
jgi:ring-1,2-phenylacetyl-CoA epoxidase subunit PaaE